MLKRLREHYYTPDSGTTWLPKRAFDSLEEIREQRYFSKWRKYVCSVCGKYHVAKNKEAKADDG